MTARTPDAEPLLTPAEVATMFRVDPKTVTRWAKAGKLTSIRTLGGHRRYREAEVRALLAGIPAAAQRGLIGRRLFQRGRLPDSAGSGKRPLCRARSPRPCVCRECVPSGGADRSRPVVRNLELRITI